MLRRTVQKAMQDGWFLKTFYSINNHMYLVRDEYKKSLVERAKEEHNINTSLLEGYETENIFKKSFIVENLDFNEVDKYENINCVLVV